MKFGLDTVVEFFDPAPERAGVGATPVPRPVKTVIDGLDGQQMTIGDAVDQIRSVTDGKIEVEFDATIPCILLYIERHSLEFCWRLLCFREVPPSARN